MSIYSEKPHLTELSEAQLRQLSDAQAVFLNLADARAAAAAVRGSMRWKRVNGKDYLVRVSIEGAERSLGPRNDELEALHSSFHERKERAETRYRAMKVRGEETRRLNRAYRVGRTPTGLVKRLDAVARAGLADSTLIVGPCALYAYETAAGVRVEQGALLEQGPAMLYDPVVSDKSQSMVSGCRFSHMVVATTGEMAMMRTLHPLDFIRWTVALPEGPNHRQQIEAVQQLWDVYLSTYMTGGNQ
jgi:hypothetical protein